MPDKEQIIEAESLPLDIKKGVTYIIKQSNPNSYTHGMFKYPCKFIPEIPRWGIKAYLLEKKGVIFDPFSGSGTTLLEANINGINAYGTEIDDVAKLIIKVKTTTLNEKQIDLLDECYLGILDIISTNDGENFRPEISNLEHWFSEDTICELGRMKAYIDNIGDADVKDFFKLCMVSIIKRVSKADDASPKPYVSNKIIKTPPPVEKEFSSVFKRYKQMMIELSKVEKMGTTCIVDGDALDFSVPHKIDLAITSPPYINAFDYGRTLRLENLWMDTLTEEMLREKKSKYVGTEKINAKNEKNNLNILNKSMLLKDYYNRLVVQDEKRALVVKRFFEDMEKNLRSVYSQINTGGKYIIVIGNSTIRKINVESWRVIEEIANEMGFKTIQHFSYIIQNPYIRIPRKGMGGKINKDCENIHIFPFRFMLKVLMKVGYLDREEIAYFLFRVKNENELDLTIKNILDFRKLSSDSRKELIDSFKDTHIGNITLVKAPSAGYFISLCQIMGIIDRISITPDNRDEEITAIKIKDEYTDYVKEMLYSKYKNAEVYDFKDNLQLWIDYIGNPDRDYPPIDISIINKSDSSFLVQVFKDGLCKYDDLIDVSGVLQVPMFVDEQYDIKIIDIQTGAEVEVLNICPTFEDREYEIAGSISSDSSVADETLEMVAREIIEHCEASNFAGKTLNYLNTLSKATGIDKTKDKALRGAYFEYYVYKLLSILKEDGIIDDVIWNGRLGRYGLPIPAPGGKTGTPDIVFVIDDLHIVLELTTIKAKSLQFSQEGSSVPDHIRIYKQESGEDVVGVFCAPAIHERNNAAMKSTIAPYGIELHCITDKELVQILLSGDREKIKEIKVGDK